jgi:hypothetical protein
MPEAKQMICDQQHLTSDDADARNKLTAPWLSEEPYM